MRKIFLFSIFFISLFCSSQTLVNTFKFGDSDLKKLYRISNEDDDKNVFIIKNKENTDFVLFDENFNETNKISLPNENKSFDFIGYTISNSIYYTYWKKSDEEIEVKEIDFSKNVVNTTYLPFSLGKKERVLSLFNYNNKLHAFSIDKETNNFNITVFDNYVIKKNNIDCSAFRFLDSDNKKSDLWDFITERNGTVYRDGFKFFKASSENINQVFATQKKKIFQYDNRLIITLDDNVDFCQIIFIDLNDYKISLKIIGKDRNKPKNNPDSEFKIIGDTNSFIVNDKIFMLTFDGEVITLIVKDLDNNLLKQMILSSEKNDFEKIELVEENGSFSKRKLLDKPSVFARRATFLNPSISGYQKDNQYFLTLGGVSYPQPNSPMLGMFGAIGAIIGNIIEYSSQSSVSSYSDKKIIYLKCKLDLNSELVNENIGESTIDKIRSFLETNNSKEEFLSPFEFKNNLYLTSINKKENKFSFYKF